MFDILKEEGIDFYDIKEKLSEEYRNLISEPENLENEVIFPFELYMEIMRQICVGKGKEFAEFIGRKSAELFILKELRIARRIKDIDWLISKDLLIGDSFYGGGKYVTERISENEIKVKFENMDKTNEFVEEKIKGFLEGIFEAAGLKTEVSIISSPFAGSPFLEISIKW